MSIIAFTDLEKFKQKVKTSNHLLVDFHADWCGPCQAMKPYLKKISVEYEGALDVVTVNTDEASEIAKKYRVQGLPTFLLFFKGTAVKKIVGADPNKLQIAVEELCSRK